MNQFDINILTYIMFALGLFIGWFKGRHDFKEAALLLGECHKVLKSCGELPPEYTKDCICLHCRVEQFIAQKTGKIAGCAQCVNAHE